MEITANAQQNVTMGNNVVFTDTAIGGCSSIIVREGSGLIKLRGLTNNQCRARFRAWFGANIAAPSGGTAGPISLVMSLDGEPISTTKMIATVSAVNEFSNISSSIYIDIPSGCCATLGIKNVDGPEIVVQNANLIVERVA